MSPIQSCRVLTTFHNLKVNFHQFFYEDFHLFENAPAAVIRFLVFERKALVWSEASVVSYTDFVDGLPPPQVRSSHKRNKDCLDVDDAMETGHIQHRRIFGKQSVVGPLAPSADAFRPGLDGVELDDIYKAAEEAPIFFVDFRSDVADFVVVPYSGHCSGLGLSVIDSYQARPHGELETTWVEHNFPRGMRSMTCSIKKYTMPLAVALCNLWSAMMAHWYVQWLEEDCRDDVEYDRLDAKKLVPVHFLETIQALPVGHPAVERFNRISASLYPDP